MLNGLWAAFRHELVVFRVTPGTWLFVALTIMASMLATFYVGGIYSTNKASLVPFFKNLPWVMMLFVPALTMGAWSSEWRNGTIERLLTLPLSLFAISSAKFLAAWVVLLTTFVLTSSLVMTVSYLGDLDVPMVLSGYLGALLLGGVFLSVSLMASMVSRSQAGAFSLSLIILFFMMTAGWRVTTNMMQGVMTPWLLDFMVWFSVLGRYQNMMSGLIDMRDIIFFLTLTIFFAAATQSVLYWKLEQKKRSSFVLVIAFLLVSFNGAIKDVRLQKDVTEEKLYTLSEMSVDMLKSLNHKVEIKFVYSSGNTHVPASIHYFANQVMDFLHFVEDINPEFIDVKILNPEHRIEDEMFVQRSGVSEVVLPNGDVYYLGLMFSSGDRIGVMPELIPERGSFLEYDVVSGLVSLQTARKDNILVLSNVDFTGTAYPAFLSELSAMYDVSVTSKAVKDIPQTTDLVITAYAPYLHQETVYALDQYIVHGGKALFLLDPYVRDPIRSDVSHPDRNADARSMNHPADLLRSWGVKYHYDEVVGDKASAASVYVKDLGQVHYPLWLELGQENVNPELPFAQTLQEMMLLESGYFTKHHKVLGLKYEPVLTSGARSQVVKRSFFEKGSVEEVLLALTGTEEEKDLAGIITGNFPSAYEVLLPEKERSHRYQGRDNGAVMFVADTDFLSETYSLEERRIGNRVLLEPVNDNMIFMFNMVQYMLGEAEILQLRAKHEKYRPFSKIHDMVASSSEKFQKMETKLSRELSDTKRKLAELRHEIGSDSSTRDKIKREINTYRQKELATRKALREVRRETRADIDKLGQLLALGNITFIPIFLFVIGGVGFIRRRRK